VYLNSVASTGAVCGRYRVSSIRRAQNLILMQVFIECLGKKLHEASEFTEFSLGSH